MDELCSLYKSFDEAVEKYFSKLPEDKQEEFIKLQKAFEVSERIIKERQQKKKDKVEHPARVILVTDRVNEPVLMKQYISENYIPVED